MIMIMRFNGEIELVTAVCGEVPTRGHSHHLLHLLLTVGQVGQEAALQLLPGRAVGHAQPLPLGDEGVGQVTYLWTVCLHAVIFSFPLFSVSLKVFNLHGVVWIVNCQRYCSKSKRKGGKTDPCQTNMFNVSDPLGL